MVNKTSDAREALGNLVPDMARSRGDSEVNDHGWRTDPLTGERVRYAPREKRPDLRDP